MPSVARGFEELRTAMEYGLFQWIFLTLAFICGISALLRAEVFSSVSSQRTHHHSQQQVLLWLVTIVFALAGFVTAVLAVRAGMR